MEACTAYEKARDLDAVVRLNLDHMRNPQRAMQVKGITFAEQVLANALVINEMYFVRNCVDVDCARDSLHRGCGYDKLVLQKGWQYSRGD